jgi:GntR family transcriptional regulator, carbon starvation induced regulator
MKGGVGQGTRGCSTTASWLACDNHWLMRMRRDMLFAQSERYRRLSVALQADRRDLDAEHHGLMEAALAHDAAAATERMRAHLMLTTEILLESELIS